MKKSNIVYVEGYFARTDEEPVNRVAVLQQEKNELKKENFEEFFNYFTYLDDTICGVKE